MATTAARGYPRRNRVIRRFASLAEASSNAETTIVSCFARRPRTNLRAAAGRPLTVATTAAGTVAVAVVDRPLNPGMAGRTGGAAASAEGTPSKNSATTRTNRFI